MFQWTQKDCCRLSLRLITSKTVRPSRSYIICFILFYSSVQPTYLLGKQVSKKFGVLRPLPFEKAGELLQHISTFRCHYVKNRHWPKNTLVLRPVEIPRVFFSGTIIMGGGIRDPRPLSAHHDKKKKKKKVLSSTHKGVNWLSKSVTQVQLRRPESPTVTLTCHACKYKVHKLHQRYILSSSGGVYLWWRFCTLYLHACQVRVPLVEFMYLVFTRMPGESSVPLVEFMYLVFTHMPGESYRRRLGSYFER